MEHRDKQILVNEEATEWFLRLKDDGLAAAEQDEYLQWLKASPDHIAEALRMGRLFARLRRVGVEGPAFEIAESEPSNVVDLTRREPSADEPPSTSSGSGGGRLWAKAAALSVLALGTLLVLGIQLGWLGDAIETDASEWRRFTLADGSVVRAGPRTRLQIEFDDAQRVIQLPDGEALFQVAKDPNRPFYVNAGAAVVRAVGTEFGVSRKDGKVLVTVAEGLVSVSQVTQPSRWFRGDGDSSGGSGAHKPVAVAAGQQAAVPSAGPVTVQRVNVPKELAWAEGRLIFESRTTVAEAIGEFNKRNHLQIVLEDRAIASSSVLGVFDAADPESFAQFIAKVFHASIVRDTPGILFLQPQEGASDDASDDGVTVLPPISTDAQPLGESPTGTRTSPAL